MVSSQVSTAKQQLRPEGRDGNKQRRQSLIKLPQLFPKQMSDCVPDTFTVHFHARIIKESWDLSSEKDQVGGQAGSVKEGGEPAGVSQAMGPQKGSSSSVCTRMETLANL